MSIRCKSCGKFIWSFSETLCGDCRQAEINATYRNRDLYVHRTSSRFVPRGNSSPSVDVSSVADVDYTPVIAAVSNWSDSSSYSDSGSYSCSDGGGSSCGGCD